MEPRPPAVRENCRAVAEGTTWALAVTAPQANRIENKLTIDIFIKTNSVQSRKMLR